MSHKWTGLQQGGSPSEEGSYEWVRYCKLCGMEDSGEDNLPPCPADPSHLINDFGDNALLNAVRSCWLARAAALYDVGEHLTAQAYEAGAGLLVDAYAKVSHDDNLTGSHQQGARPNALKQQQVSDTFTDENGTVWVQPTAEAYRQACKALQAAAAANRAEFEAHKLTIQDDRRELEQLRAELHAAVEALRWYDVQPQHAHIIKAYDEHYR